MICGYIFWFISLTHSNKYKYIFSISYFNKIRSLIIAITVIVIRRKKNRTREGGERTLVVILS